MIRCKYSKLFQTIEWQTFEARQIHKFEGGGHQSTPFSSVVVDVALRLGSNVESEQTIRKQHETSCFY